MPKKPKFEDPTFEDPTLDNAGSSSGEVNDDPASGAPASKVGGVLQKHEQRLLGIAGVKGVGETLGPLGEPAIVVYLTHAGVARSLPSTLDGLPVVTQVVGEVDAYGAKPRRQ